VKQDGPLVFVGERRSQRAISMGVTWGDGRLAARTLFEALQAAGVDPHTQRFVNLFPDPPAARIPDERVLTELRAVPAHRLVALGSLVAVALKRAGIAHRLLAHPAARGAIRKRERYHAHVAAVLADVATTPEGVTA
jgi:hypothetical protein